MKTKRPKIEIGTTFPHWHEDRYVNAEVVSRQKYGRGWLWTVRLTESQQPVIRKEGPLAGTVVEFQAVTRSIADSVTCVESLPHYSPRHGSCVVQYVEFPAAGLWCEIRDQHKCGGSRNTHWRRSECETAEALLACGDAVACNS